MTSAHRSRAITSASTAAELVQAFREIGVKLTSLRLSK